MALLPIAIDFPRPHESRSFESFPPSIGFANWSAQPLFSGGPGLQASPFRSSARVTSRPVGVQYWMGEFTTQRISLRDPAYRYWASWIASRMGDPTLPVRLTFPPGGVMGGESLMVIFTDIDPHGIERHIDDGWTIRWESLVGHD